MFMYSDYEDSDIDEYDGDDYITFDDYSDYGNRCLTDFIEVTCAERYEDANASSGTVASLLDLSAKVSSRHYSYNYVESMYTYIPEPVATKFMLWSFPRSHNDLAQHFGKMNTSRISTLDDVVQIGFQVNGHCKEAGKRYDVSLCIDRCVITSASCSCGSCSMPCQHLLDLAYYRLKNAAIIPIHPPISDSLNPLNREQLLYLVNYIINKHSNILLPSAQAITNELLDKNSEKNAIPGAPDPTAGGDVEGDPVWFRKRNY